MLVAKLTGPREFRLAQEEIAPPSPGELQVRPDAVGICGSDLHSYAEGAIGDTPCQYPMVLGHEPSGTVIAVGPGVTGWSPGDRAALEPALYCYHCEFCRTGRYNVCANIRFLSNPGHPGFFRQYANLPERNLIGIPKSLSFDHATLIEPLAIGIHTLSFTDLKLGDTAAVMGAGPIGLLAIACLKLAGAGRIWAVEPMAHRRELALHMGATVVIDPGAVDPAKQILADTGQRGVDVAVDCAAKRHTTNWAIHAVRNAGRVVLSGIHSEVLVPLETSPMRRKEVALFNVRRSNHESEAALQMITAHPALFAPLVTHTRPMESIAEAFSIAEHYADGVGKLIVKP